MPVPYSEIKWIKDRLDRLEKQFAEISAKQEKMRTSLSFITRISTENDELLDKIFSERCDNLNEVAQLIIDHVIGIEAKVFPKMGNDLARLTNIIGRDTGRPNNPLDKKKPRKPV